MTTEEKELLLKDLCARLPYGLKVNIERDFPNNPQIVERIAKDGEIIVNGILAYDIYYYKPYLRHMSSMTEEEMKVFQAFHCVDGWHPYFYQQMCNLPNLENMFNWLNAHHFDYRGLIPMGLALEAPKDMYKTK